MQEATKRIFGYDICAHCGFPKSIRNPSGTCDHLYWPDCLTEEAKRANGYVAGFAGLPEQHQPTGITPLSQPYKEKE